MNDESTQRRASRPPGRRRLRSGTTLLASVATLGASALGFLAFAPATAFAATAPSNATNLGYTPITPARVCDTRSTTAAGGSDVASGVTGQCANSGTALASGGVLDVAIPTSVVPSGAQAVVLNVTAIGASASGFLSTYAATGAAPTSYISNVNFAAGQDVANSVTVQDNAGAVDVYFGPASPSATVNVAVDVEGYYMTPSATAGDPYTAITPTRVADTRCGTSPAPGYCAGENLPSANSSLTTVGANSSINVAVAGVGSVPSTATAVALNVTATNGSAASYLKVYPTGSTPAVTSNQNWMPGETLASQVVSKVGTGGDVSLYNFAGTVDYVVDVTGYYTAAGTSGSLFTSLGAPMRLADTRCAVSPTPSFCSGENLPSANSSLAAPSGGSSITVATGAPSGATSAALDVVDVMPATGNFLTAYPTGASLPVVSTVNWVPGDTYNVVPNAAYATLSSTGDTSIYNGPTNAGAANVVVDMFGYFAPPVVPVSVANLSIAVPSTTVNTISMPDSTSTTSSTRTVTATVTDGASGPAVAGDTVLFTITPSVTGETCGTLASPTETTGTNGVTPSDTYTAPVYSSGVTATSCTVTATDAFYGQTGSGVIDQTVPANTVALTATPSTLSANGTSTSSLSATVTAATSGSADSDTVTFTSSGGASCGSITPTGTGNTGATDSLPVTATYTASTTPGFCTITATEANTGGTGAVTIDQTSVPTPAVGYVTISGNSATTTTAAAPGTSGAYAASQAYGAAATYTATAFDSSTTPTPISGDPMSFVVESPATAGDVCGTVSPASTTTSSTGTASFTYTAATTASGTPDSTCTVKATEAETGASSTLVVSQTVPASVVTVTPASSTVGLGTNDTMSVSITNVTSANNGDTVSFTVTPVSSNTCGSAPASTVLSVPTGATSGTASSVYTAAGTNGFCTITATVATGATTPPSGSATIDQT